MPISPRPERRSPSAKAEIGEVRSGLGDHGIALIRIDRLDEAGGDAARVMAGDVAIKPVKPTWVSF